MKNNVVSIEHASSLLWESQVLNQNSRHSSFRSYKAEFKSKINLRCTSCNKIENGSIKRSEIVIY